MALIDTYAEWETVRGYKAYLLLEKGLSEHTLLAYLEDLARMLQYTAPQSDAEIEHTTTDELREFLIDLSDAGISPRSRARIISGLKAFFHYLLVTDKIAEDPAEKLELPQFGRHLPTILSVEEIDSMEQEADTEEWKGRRDKAMIEVLYGCGLRVSEMLGLKFSDIYASGNYIIVIGKGDKQRLVPIADSALEALDQWREARLELEVQKGCEDYVFLNNRGGRLSRVSAFKTVKKLAMEAGITKSISPHTFRHSFATHLLEGGANLRDIQEMLGHADIGTTEIYAHTELSRLRENILKYHPMNRGDKGEQLGPME